MQNFDELKNIWQQADPIALPSAKDILQEAEKAHRKIKAKIITGIVTLTFTFIYICFIAWYYNFDCITTKIGIILTLLAVVTGIVFNTQLASLLSKKADTTLDNNHYLGQLILFRNRQRFIQTKGISLYFVLLTVGILLYMYEFASRDFTFGVIVYSITLGWIVFSWFFLRKKAIAKQGKLINEQIARIESLLSSIKNEEDSNH